MVNDFTGGSFMETHYHSQFDNDTYYDEDVYRLHHELFGLLLMAIDRTRVVPLNFAGTFQKAKEALDLDWCARTEADGESLAQALDEAAALAQQVYDRAAAINRGQEPGEDAGRLERQLLNLFQQTQDTFVRIDWYGNVQFPRKACRKAWSCSTALRTAWRREISPRHCESSTRSTITAMPSCLSSGCTATSPSTYFLSLRSA